ncbi:MAG: SRPBCC domain-containing protein [Sphingosinicella sp.]|nr:SRPBCC domain-containing protein [Sphingosinicella sp.]
MDLKFTVMIHVSRPVAQVFEAVADPKELSSYFTTGGASGRLEAGTTVTWDFHDFPGAFPVEVVEVVPNERIVLKWEANEGPPDAAADGPKGAGYSTVATMSFKPTEDGRTLVQIEEKGWRETEAGLAASYGNCMGWSQMLAALKMWVEHRINLREGAYR